MGGAIAAFLVWRGNARAKRLLVLAAVGYFVLYLAPLGVRPIVVPDESRYAEIPREMIASGDWTTPHLDGLRYFQKPPLGYWATALALSTFGENAFAARLPSALAAGCSALLLFLLVRRRGRGAGTALLTAVVFLTSFEVFLVGVFNLLDTVFALFVTATMASAFLALHADGVRRRRTWLALCGTAAALAFLAKGFLAVALPASALVPYLVHERRTRDILVLSGIPLLVAALVAGPWSMLIQRAEPDFWRYFVVVEHWRRFTSDAAQHPQPLWFFVPVLVGGALPWTFLAPAAIRGLRRGATDQPLTLFALFWLAGPFLLLSLSRGKMLTYILPCFAPLAIVLADGLCRVRWTRPPVAVAGMRCCAALAACCALGLLVVQTGVFHHRLYVAGETWKWVALTGALLAWCVLSIDAARRRGLRSLATYAAAPTALFLTLHFVMPAELRAGPTPGALLRAHAAEITPDTVLIADDKTVQAVCWFYGRDDVYLLQRPGEHEYGLTYAPSRLIHLRRFPAFLASVGAGRQVVLIMATREYVRYRSRLPTAAREDVRGPLVLAVYRGEP